MDAYKEIISKIEDNFDMNYFKWDRDKYTLVDFIIKILKEKQNEHSKM